MISDDPPFLNEGDEVSAKYKGAFCEAIITNVQKRVECRVTLKHDQKTSIFYDSDIKGSLKVGSIVEVKKDQNRCVEGTIVKITDQSMYTVVFDDGDRNTLKRSKLCPKGDRHFTKSNSLDGLPLTNPEHFWSPVKKESRTKSSATNTGSESDSDDANDEECGQSSKSEELSDSKSCEVRVNQKTEEATWEKCSVDDEEVKSPTWWLDAYQDMIGKVVNIDVEDRVKKQVQIVPVLVCLPNADENKTTLTPSHMLVKSFKDGKFMAVRVSCVKSFNASLVTRTCKWTRSGLEKAQQYEDRSELPGDWDKKELLGWTEIENLSDEEQNEKKDRFVAELYRFMEERGTPIDKVPSIIPGVDVNLCSLYRAVQTLGGFNKVTNLMKWNVVVTSLNFKSDVTASKVKEAYKKFLHAFEEIDKRLGCNTIVANKVRSTSGRNLSSSKEGDGKKEVKSKKLVAADEIELKNPSSPNSSPDPRNVSTPLTTKPGKKIKETQKITPTTDTPSRPHKNIRNDSESHKTAESSGTSCTKVGKSSSKDSTPKSLRKLSRDEVERGGKEQKSALQQSHSNPNMMKKVIDVKPSKASSDDMNKLKHQGSSTTKHFKASEADVGKMERMRSSSKVDWSEEAKKSEKLEKVTPTSGRRTLRRIASSDDAKMQEAMACDGVSSVGYNRRKSDDILGPGTRVVVRYGKGKVAKTYEAKVLEVDMKQGLLKYLVHYNGWNSRYDEWVEREEIVNVLELIQPSTSDLKKVKNPSHHARTPRKKSRMVDDNASLKHKKNDECNYHHQGGYNDYPRVGRKRKMKITKSTASNESNEQIVSDEELISKDASDDDEEEETDDKESRKDLQMGNIPENIQVEEMIEKQDANDKIHRGDDNDDAKKEDQIDVLDVNVELPSDVEKKENEPEFKDEEPMLDHVDDEDVMNNSGLGPPTLFSSHEMEEEFSGHLRNKQLLSSTDCLPCLVKEKDGTGEACEAEVSDCPRTTAKDVADVDEQIETAEIKIPKRPGRKRKVSEADESHVPKRRTVESQIETQLIAEEVHDDAVEETACESELMEENIAESFEKLKEHNVSLKSQEELSQLHGEWSGDMNEFTEVADCTLLSQFANECTKESDNMISNMLTISVDNSPPETSSDDCCLEPAEVTVENEDEEEDDDEEEKEEDEEGAAVVRGDDEEGSTRSEREANQEVASYMKHSKSPLQPIIDSPSANEFSTASNDSCTAGLGRKIEDVVSQKRLKRKKLQESCLVPVRKKLKKEDGCSMRRRRSRGNTNLSESDGESSPQHQPALRATPTKMGMHSKHHSTPNKSVKSLHHRNSTNMKDKNLNFLDLEEGKYLIGEERIDFIMRKITQLKVAYMELKSELACLDRRRRRNRMKEGRRSVVEKDPSLCSSRNIKSKRRREDVVVDDDGDRMFAFLDNQKSEAVDISLATETVSEHNSVGGNLVVDDIENILEAFDFNQPHSLALKKMIDKFVDSNDIGILSDLASCFMENLNSIDHRQARLNECLEMLDTKVRREVESDSESNDSDYDDGYAESHESASTCSEMRRRPEGIALMS